MEANILKIIEAILPSLCVGVVMAFYNRKQNIKHREADEREKNLRRKDKLEIALLVASAELSYAISMAIKRGHPNGEIEKAVEKYDIAMQKFRDFEQDQLYDID